MNAKLKFTGLMIVAALTMFFVQSCSKDNTGSMSGTDLAEAQDEAFADAMYQEVDNMVFDQVSALDAHSYMTTSLKSSSDEGECFTVTVDHPDTTSFPKVITLDYGTGCTVVFNNDTITRKGKIIITISDRWFMQGASYTVTLNNFYLNDVKLEGTRTITNKGLNSKGHLEMEIELQGGKVIFNDTTFITRDADHVREWIRNYFPKNDTLLITGSANGINVKGETYSRIITKPLILVHCKDFSWRWVIVGGSVEVTNSVTGTTTINYTATDCDGTVIINKNGFRHNYQFVYKRHNHWRNH